MRVHASALLVTHSEGTSTSTKRAGNTEEMMMEAWGRLADFYDQLIKFH